MSDNADTPTDPTRSDEEVERLRAERDALQAQLADTTRVKRHRIRNTLAVFAVLLTCVSVFAASVGVWTHRSLLNNEVWVERVGPLASEPEVQAALSRWTTAEIMSLVNPQKLIADALPDRAKLLAVPLAGAVNDFVKGRVDKYLASDKFQKRWVAVNKFAHEQAVKVLKGEGDIVGVVGGKVVLNLMPVINEALTAITSLSPTILGKRVDIPNVSVTQLPEGARKRLEKVLGHPIDKDFGVVTVFKAKKLKAAQQAVRIFDRAVVLAILLVILLIPSALLLSTRRRRTALQLLFGSAVALVLLRRLSLLLIDQVVAGVKVPANKGAADVVVHVVVDPLLSSTQAVLTGILVVAVLLVITGPYPWMVRIRHWIANLFRTIFAAARGGAGDPAVAAYAAAHQSGLQVAGVGVIGVALWGLDLNWLTFLILVAVAVVYFLAVRRLAERGQPDDGEGSDTPAPEPPLATT